MTCTYPRKPALNVDTADMGSKPLGAIFSAGTRPAEGGAPHQRGGDRPVLGGKTGHRGFMAVKPRGWCFIIAASCRKRR